MLDKRELRSRTVKRQYGMHMTEARKRQGEIYIRDWLNTVRRTEENGKQLLNLHKIYDPALLMELIKFNHKGNFDRVMSFQHNYVRTPLGGFINHSETPNCELIEDDEDDDYKKLKTTKKIEAGEELTLKYSLYAICDYL